MSWDDLGAVGSLVGGLGTFGALIVIICQIYLSIKQATNDYEERINATDVDPALDSP